MTQLGVPSTVRSSFSRNSAVFQQTIIHSLFLIVAAIATVYIVLLGDTVLQLRPSLAILSLYHRRAFGALLALELFMPLSA